MVEAEDRFARFIAARVAAGGEHDADRGIAPTERRRRVEPASRCGVEDREQVTFHSDHERLGLRIPEAHVELDHVGVARVVDHQSDEEHALVGMAVGLHAVDRRVHDPLEDLLLDRLGDDRRRGVGAHAPGVLAFVAVEGALVVLRRGQGHDPLAVTEGVVGGFLTLQPFLDHDAIAGRAEALVGHHLVDRRVGRRSIRTHRDALARREPVRLHDAGPTELIDVVVGGPRFVEDLVGRGRDPVPRHEVLREGLAALELRRRGRGAEGRDSDVTQAIRQARRERILGSNDDEVDRLALGQRDHPVEVVRLGLRVAGREPTDRLAARRRVERRELWALRDLPRERVLAASAADHQDLHGLIISLHPVSRREPSARGSMPEVSFARHQHRDAELVRRLDHQLVAVRAPWLDDRRGAGLDRRLEPIREGEEGVTCEHAPVEGEPDPSGLGDRVQNGVDPRRRATADRERPVV